MAGSESHVAIASLGVVLAGCFGGGGITPIQTPFNRGVYLQSAGDLDGAIAEYREAVEEDPSDLRAAFNLGTALEAKADLGGADATKLREAAATRYRQILDAEPRHLRAAVNLAAIEWDRGHAATAESLLAAAAEANPDQPLPHTARAARRLLAADLDGAEAALRAAESIDSTDPRTQSLLGIVLERKGDLEAARAAHRLALGRGTDDLGVLIEAGRFELDHGDPVVAASLCDRALFIDDDSWRARWLAHRAALKHDDLEAATLHLWFARDLDHARPRSIERPAYAELLRELYVRLSKT